MIGAGEALRGHDLSSKRAKATLHAITDDGAADLAGDSEADAHRRVGVGSVADEKDEAGRRRALAGVRGEEVGALLDRC
jgi:hypothetical protein